jgi:hypothetical protein
MPSTIVPYLAGRPDSSTFLVTSEIGRALDEIFPRAVALLPEPYRIFPVDETQAASLGFPVAESQAMRDLEAKLDRWLTDETVWQIKRDQTSRERAALSFTAYIGHLMKAAENALMSNLLNDYHAVFWLAHSFDLARHFSTMPRRVSSIDTQAGRTQGDALKYRLFARWAAETRDQMTQLATRAASVLDGEEQRGLQFFRLLQDDVLIFTEEFIGPDLRELRSFITGYLRRDFQQFRDTTERLRESAVDLLNRDKTFRAALPLFGVNPDLGISLALLLDSRFQSLLFETAPVQNAVNREDREQFQLIARRLREFAVLNQLRRGIVWMTSTPDGQIVASDRRSGAVYSRSTRPLDFSRPGVVDPMVHRFGLIYDISAFSETLGNLRRSGQKSEVSSYRQMVLFQRKLDSIAERHSLIFEKFLGDGAFYTTRRALRLVRAAIEIQRFYAEMRRKGFAFNKGLRIAVNYGYYRLLPMKAMGGGSERITEFYGPGIVELSRLTTGKATKEIDDLASFLIAHGYDHQNVQQFFAPLARGVDVVDRTQHAREYYAYINASGHMINEGIVGSFAFLQELSQELMNEGQRLYRLKVPWGSYIGFTPAMQGIEYAGIRILGMVSLKGLDNVEIGEIAPFAPGEVIEATPLDPSDSLAALLRLEFHLERDDEPVAATPNIHGGAVRHLNDRTTSERFVEPELVICLRPEPNGNDEVLIGEWDPTSDDLIRPLRMPRNDFQRLFSLKGDLTTDVLALRKASVREMYHRLSEHASPDAVPLETFRSTEYDTFVLGDVVEKL